MDSSLYFQKSKTFSDAWQNFNGVDYYFSANNMAQDDARTCCQYAGADLASITSDEENTYMHGVYVFHLIILAHIAYFSVVDL